MKNLYSITFCFLIFIFGYIGCTSDDIYSLEHNIIQNEATAIFSLSNNLNNKIKYTVSDSVLATNNQSIHATTQEEEWNTRRFSDTKTSWGNSNNTVTWTANDKVGIFMRDASGTSITYIDRNNVEYNVNTSGTSSSALTANSSPIYFPRPYTQNVRFFAYYPYSASANTLVLNYTLPTDQSTAQALSNADIMNASSSSTNGSNPNVTLNFNHQMVLLSFQIKTAILPSTLTKVTISGSSITNTGTLNLSTGTLTPNTSVTFAPFVNTNQTVSPSVTGYVNIIINPCTINNNASSSQLMVSLTFNNLLTHTTNLFTSKTLVAGTRYIYNVTLVTL